MEDGTFYRMTPLEIASGWVGGLDPPPDEPPEIPAHPLDALREILLPALQQEPCVVAFSGGRDSSAVLAVAVDVARREGLPLPIPATDFYPNVPETDEREWQELVLRHLGITEWERIAYDDDGDLVGPVAARSLRRHGLLWPPSIHVRERAWKVAGGGTLITGEGGDEVFGIRRITPMTGLLRRRVHPRRRAARVAAQALSPAIIRRRAIGARLDTAADRPWLKPAARAAVREALVTQALAEPLRWDTGIVALRRRRGTRIGLHNLGLAASSHGVTYLHPLLEPAFMHSWAAYGGHLGFPGRTAATRELFADYLPNRAIERESKVFFNEVRVGKPSRKFIESWNGAGVDAELVDIAKLRQAWRDEHTHAGSMVLLQAAWLWSASVSGSGPS